MSIISSLLLLVLMMACIYFSYTDLRYNQIKSNKLVVFGTIGIIWDIVLYVGYQRDMAKYAVFTVLILGTISIALYAMHIWAAGDSKLMILIGLLIPPLDSERGSLILNEIMIPVYAFGIGFLYLIVDTGIHMVKKEYRFTSTMKIK